MKQKKETEESEKVKLPPINEQLIKDSIFAADVMVTARNVSRLDHERITKLLQDADTVGSVAWVPAGDDVSRRMNTCLAIMAFAAKELAPILPDTPEVAEKNHEAFKRIQGGDKLEGLLKKFAKELQGFEEEHVK